jgi:Ca-activated chloride channel homolog
VRGRHRPTGRFSSSPARTTLVVAAVAVIASGTILVVQSLAGAGGCSERDGVELPVAADPAIAPALREIADDWTESEEPEVDGRCVAVDVAAVASADVASALATSAGGLVDVAAAAQAPVDPPAVWVPDSSYWIDRSRAVSRTLFESDPAPLASSPIVLAATPAGAELLGAGPVPPTALREPVLAALAEQQPPPVRLAEPRRDTAGLVGAGWLEAALVTADQELPNLVGAFRRQGTAPPDTASLLAGLGEEPLFGPASEQAVAAHNRAGSAPLTAIPVEGAPSLDFPYALLARQPLDVQTAAATFQDALTSSPQVFGQHGFQAPDAAAPLGAAVEQLGAALRIWTSATRDARVLSVVNVNASMDESLGEARRIDVFKATAQQGLELFTGNSQLGLWEYADELTETVPIDTLTDDHTQRILSAIGGAEPRGTDESALFEALLAGYQEMKDGYDPGRSNTLIVWTDSGNNQPGGPSLEEAVRELERLADVTRPIRVILLGLGPDAGMTDLAEIARVTGGGAFHLEDPDEIALIFLRALLT